MTQALQLLAVAVVGLGLAWYGLIQGRREQLAEQVRKDSRQQSLFPQSGHVSRELATR
jgi:uncharacterized protein HemX